MKTHGEMTIEKQKFFPYVAWTLIVFFALFVGNLVWSLFETTSKLDDNTSRLQQIANSDFDGYDLDNELPSSESE